MNVTHFSEMLGAEVEGVDCRDVSDRDLAALQALLWDRGMLSIPNQDLTPDSQVAFAERWGAINVNRFFTPVAANPRVAEVLKEGDQELNIGGGWHTDHSYDEIPAMGSMLYALEIPETGGDTLFASMYAAYAKLSDGFKQALSSMRAVHSSRHVFGNERIAGDRPRKRLRNPELAIQDAVHPVVIEHPESGRPSLYVNPSFTVRFDGWSKAESQSLLAYLYRFGARPEHTIRYRWKPGTLVIWDNRATWHYALNDYPGQRRLMHRVTVEGVRLEAIN